MLYNSPVKHDDYQRFFNYLPIEMILVYITNMHKKVPKKLNNLTYYTVMVF